MEMEYTHRHSRRSKLYIGVGLIVALVVGAVVFVALQFSGVTQEAAVEMRAVVVATQEIPARTAIAEDQLQVRRFPADPTNASAFTSLEEVVGRIATVPIPLGQILSPNLLASTVSGQEYSILEPGEEFDPDGADLRAVSLAVPDDRAVAGTLQPGQRVDLIVTLTVNPLTGQDGGATQTDLVAGPSTKATLQIVTILSRTGGLYIVRTDLPTAEMIAEFQAVGGQFSFALRPEEDDRTADTTGSTVDMLLEEFDFPLPRAGALRIETPTDAGSNGGADDTGEDEPAGTPEDESEDDEPP